MAIRGITRFGVVLLVIGISLGLLSILRSSSIYSREVGLGVVAHDSQMLVFRVPPRSLRLEVNASGDVDIHVLDELGVRLWDEGKLAPIHSFEEVKHALYVIELNGRGDYYFLICNLLDSPSVVNLRLTFYGFEKDIVMVAIILTVSGFSIVLLRRVAVRIKKGSYPSSCFD